MSNSDECAFPVEESELVNFHKGLTKREHFAGLAMQALLSNSLMGDASMHESPEEWVKQITESGVEFADALLKELDKGSK